MFEFKINFNEKMHGIWEENKIIFVKIDKDDKEKAISVLEKALKNREELKINSIKKV